MKTFSVCAATLVASAFFTPTASAVTVGGTSQFAINDGASIDATVSLAPNAFNQEFAISTDTTTFMGMTFSFGSIALSDIPASGGNFGFWFDSNEPGNDPAMNIDEILMVVDGVTVFDYDQSTFGSLMLDGTTNSPLGTGGDMLLNVPVASFLGNGFTGNSVLSFYWKQSDASQGNNPDQWTTVGSGFFDPNDSLDPVPLPAALPLLAGALGGAALLRRRRRT